MIGAFKRLISKSKDIEEISEDTDIRVACAALLSEAAAMDMNFGEALALMLLTGFRFRKKGKSKLLLWSVADSS